MPKIAFDANHADAAMSEQCLVLDGLETIV